MSQTFWTVVVDIPGEPPAPPSGAACLLATRGEAERWADTLLRTRPGIFRVARCEVEVVPWFWNCGSDRSPDQVNPPVGPPDSDRSFLGTLAQRVSVLEAHDKDRADIQIRLDNIEERFKILRSWRDQMGAAAKKMLDILRAADAGLL